MYIEKMKRNLEFKNAEIIALVEKLEAAQLEISGIDLGPAPKPFQNVAAMRLGQVIDRLLVADGINQEQKANPKKEVKPEKEAKPKKEVKPHPVQFFEGFPIKDTPNKKPKKAL